MQEIWKDAIGYEGKYLVSNMGRVYSLISGRLLGNKNRWRVTVQLQGKTRKVHRLVYETFNGPTDLFVCHKNGNPHDNRLENLYAGNQSQNQLDAVRHGTQQGLKNKGEANGMATYSESTVKEILRRSAEGETNTSIATSLGLNRRYVGRIVKRERWSHVQFP